MSKHDEDCVELDPRNGEDIYLGEIIEKRCVIVNGYLFVTNNINVKNNMRCKSCIWGQDIVVDGNLIVDVGDVSARSINVTGDLIAERGYVFAEGDINVGGKLKSRVVHSESGNIRAGDIESEVVNYNNYIDYIRGGKTFQKFD